ncbi:MAG: rhodanese-like domain-containing protein [Actinomycetota bacterium]
MPEIDVDALAAELAAGRPLVDVREPDEYADARVPGGVLIPLATVPERLDEIPSEGTVYVVCRSGGRSAQAVAYLRDRGVDAVNVAGGTLAWMEADREVDRG